MFRCLFSIVCCTVACLQFAACSVLRPSPDPELKRVLTLVSSSYLGAAVLGDVRAIHGFSIWPDLTRSMGEDTYTKRVQAMQGRWDDEHHPLKGLDLGDVVIGTDRAVVTFKKVNGPEQGPVWVKLVWHGSAWLVVDDSLFGNGELISKLTEEKSGA